MGGKPLFALNIVAFPLEELPLDTLVEILRGGADIAKKAKIPILGGHSIKDREPKYGLVVTGVPRSRVVRNSTAKIGDILILTKPLGLGVVSTAIKRNIANKSCIDSAVDVMVSLNDKASETMVQVGVNACTDITGFGLLGHLNEMCRASELTATISFDKIDFIESAIDFAKDGVVPGGSKKNLELLENDIKFSENLNLHHKHLLADAQTSGGLLISVSEKNSEDLMEKLTDCNTFEPRVIGRFEAKTTDKYILVS